MVRLTVPPWPGLDPLLRPGVPLRSLFEKVRQVGGPLRPLLREAARPDAPLSNLRDAGCVRHASPVLSPSGEAYDGRAATTYQTVPPDHRATAAPAVIRVTGGPALARCGRDRAHAEPAHTRRPPPWPRGPMPDGPAPASAGDGPAQQQANAADLTYGGLHVPEPRDTAPRAALHVPLAVGGKPSVSPD